MTPEGCVLKSIIDYLGVTRVWHRRFNTGAIATEKRFFRFGSKGMADIMATPINKWGYPVICWIECKTATGRQSPDQKLFEQEVREAGHKYIIAKSIEDVQVLIKSVTL